MKRFFNSLAWKIGATFLALLSLLSFVYLFIAVWTAEMYYQETMQKLGSQIAPNIVQENHFFNNGEIDEESLKELFHNIMVINPSLEVYLLDTEGNIKTYYAPNKNILLKKLDLTPIQFFIETKGEKFVMGNDPKEPSAHKTFSTAQIYEDDILRGYLYIVMEGEEFINATQFVFGSYMLRLAVRSISITLIGSALISLLAIGFITKNLRIIAATIRKFKNGDIHTRIALKGGGELKEFADSFNQMADTLIQNMEDLKTMDTLRRELVANVSHDLRTPLATIQGYVETILIKNDSLTETERLKHLQTILASSERLKKLVEELFELSKLEARETTPNPEPFQLSELVQDIYLKSKVLAEKNKISIQVYAPQDLPLVMADIGMIEKVLQNLIDNAIKFTPEHGKISIKLTNEKNVKVYVSDSGKGMRTEEIPHIFDRYNQGKKSVKKAHGIGLGLAIVKKILEVHGIEIEVTSSLNKGSTFSFDVPTYTKESVKSSFHLT